MLREASANRRGLHAGHPARHSATADPVRNSSATDGREQGRRAERRPPAVTSHTPLHLAGILCRRSPGFAAGAPPGPAASGHEARTHFLRRPAPRAARRQQSGRKPLCSDHRSPHSCRLLASNCRRRARKTTLAVRRLARATSESPGGAAAKRPLGRRFHG